MRFRRTATAAVVAVALTAGTAGAIAAGSAGSAGNRSRAGSRLAITAFQEAGDSNSLITRSATAITTVGVDGVDLTTNGKHVGAPDATARASLSVAHADHLRAEVLIGNWDDSINDFSEAVAHRLLDSPTNIGKVAKSLAESVISEGWDGVSVDLESLHARDRAGLVRFLKALRADLPAGKTLSVCITNYTSASGYLANGYDLGAIGETVSRVILMAYDEHGSWENTPGPVGALNWQKAGLAVLRRYVPADKVDLGEAGYGYAWRPHSNDQLSDARARELVTQDHAQARFVASVGEWTAHLSDGSTLWWADARSFRLRVKLARADHLHGLAMWDLGLSDPIS